MSVYERIPRFLLSITLFFKIVQTIVQFGRFKKGKLISLPAGDYTYVGSALSEKGATSLARRLVRHATRNGDKPPHAIREAMVKQFHDCGLGPPDPLPQNGKKLFWNIDFLLDLQLTEIINVIAMRSPKRLEHTIAELLERDANTQIIEKGLGANDTPTIHMYCVSTQMKRGGYHSLIIYRKTF